MGGRSNFDDMPVMNHHDAVGYVFDNTQIMRHHDERHLRFGGTDRLERFENLHACGNVDGALRLVSKQHGRMVDNGAGDRGTLCLPSG